MNKNYAFLCWLIMVTCLLAACAAPLTPDATATELELLARAVALPNPASVYCLDQGGQLEIRKDDQGGEYGVCIFPDGSQCEEWAFYRDECQLGSETSSPAAQDVPMMIYLNQDNGLQIVPPVPGWMIAESPNGVFLRKESYELFIGYKHATEQVEQFRTGMPAGDLVNSGTFLLGGYERLRRDLVFQGKVKLVDFGSDLPVGDLLLTIWLDVPQVEDTAYVDIPEQIITEAQRILAALKVSPTD